MTTIKNLKRLRAIAVCSLVLVAAISAYAQGGGRGGGGGGGGGGFGGGFGTGGGFRNTSSSSSSSTGGSTRDYQNSTEPGDVSVTYDPETHSLVVLTDDKTLGMVKSVVSNLDQPKPQVLIKVVFLEVQYDNALDFGVQASYSRGVSGLPGSNNVVALANAFGLQSLGTGGETIGQTVMPTGEGLYSVMGSDLQATVRAIASASKVSVLSRPSIMVRNNQPATITVGQSVPLVNGVTFPSTTSGPVSSITYQNVGIILQVTPFISTDGLVEMICSPQISSISSQTVSIATNQNAPIIDLRSANTVVVAPDGQTVVIGGLMENDKTTIDSKIPLLGDIPLLGNLFKHKENADTKKELMIFLTPHVVNMPSQVADVTAYEKRQAEREQRAIKEQELDKYLDKLPQKPHSIWDQPTATTTNTFK
jgi:general secretion pathway protein D